MKRFFFIIQLFLLLSCSNKNQNSIENFLDNFSFNTTKSNSTQLIIKLYDTTITKKRSSDVESFISKKEFKTASKRQVIDFDNVFINAEKTGYCCCPVAIYSIHFFNKKEELDFFYVDTLEFTDKIRIYEKRFQYSYIVEKQKWKNYLAEIQNKT